jgi:hypothetical protein
MFVQIIQGRTADPAGLRAALDTWVASLAPSAPGWLGSTAGVTDDGRFVTIARFESEAAARANSDRPEQGQWWASTAHLFSDDAVFTNSSNATVDMAGDPDRAGFVQVMQGRLSDPERAQQLMSDDSLDWQSFRPDILGSITVAHNHGSYTMAIYFESEQAAREGEAKQPPPDVAAAMAEMAALEVGQPEFFDLRDPWLYSPG